MRQSFRWTAFLYLCIIGLFVTLAGMTSKAYADTSYSVNQGDTLWTIAETNHTSVGRLMQANHLQTTVLQIHQVLYIPDSTKHHAITSHRVSKKAKPIVISLSKRHQSEYHTVQPGDTLWTIAVENHMTVETLMAVNHLDSEMIYPGQKLEVSGSAHPLTYQPLRRETLRTVDFQIAREKGIPAQLIPVYQAAGKKYGIPWTVLAAIHRRETDFSTSAVVSCAGAEGPMQFMPSTFERYAVAAPGDCAPNINNVNDAIYTAAHMLAADGYGKNPTEALYQYNHSLTYVYSIESLAQNYQD